MARIKGALMTRKRRKKVLKLAKGYWGSKSRHFKMAKQAVMKSGNYAYIGRKHRKRDFRRLWITRISAAAQLNGMNYSTFMNGLKKANVGLNRKMLSEIAIADPVLSLHWLKQQKKLLHNNKLRFALGNLPGALLLIDKYNNIGKKGWEFGGMDHQPEK